MKGRPKLYTEQQYQECAEAYEDGQSLNEAASTHGMTGATLGVWMESQGIPRRAASRPRTSKPIGGEAYFEPAETINLYELTNGECVRLKGLCEFNTCRYRCVGGGCAIKIGGNGAHSLEDVASLVGVTRVATQNIIERGLTKLRNPMGAWR